MFCHKCGTKIADDATFCHKCGTKVVNMDATKQVPIVSQENLNSENVYTLLSKKNTETLLDSVKMVISIDKVTGKAYSTYTFPIFVDGIQIGDLANGQTTAYRILPGHHLIKIAAFVIGIDVPKGDASVELDFHWGENVKPEIICHQSHWVSKPCEKEKIPVRAMFESINTGIKVGLVCSAIGWIGFVIGAILMPSSGSGGIVSAEWHSANLAQMDIALLLFISGLFLAMIGAIIMIHSSRTKKK